MHLLDPRLGPSWTGLPNRYQQSIVWWSRIGRRPLSSSPRADRLPRIGGALALDFCNTSTGRGAGQRHVEHLFDYEDLLRWSVFNEVMSPEGAAALAAGAAPDEQARVFALAMRHRAMLNGA